MAFRPIRPPKRKGPTERPLGLLIPYRALCEADFQLYVKMQNACQDALNAVTKTSGGLAVQFFDDDPITGESRLDPLQAAKFGEEMGLCKIISVDPLEIEGIAPTSGQIVAFQYQKTIAIQAHYMPLIRAARNEYLLANSLPLETE